MLGLMASMCGLSSLHLKDFSKYCVYWWVYYEETSTYRLLVLSTMLTHLVFFVSEASLFQIC